MFIKDPQGNHFSGPQGMLLLIKNKFKTIFKIV